ncbi:hypothetical protein ACFYLX_03685 [Pseudarthrobacter enclensis]|uniref:hypothetical protein n=1 Tax=Pseudarthrobacter enclensis TaxID=993070 RepID=UPI0036B7F325
MTYLTGSKTPQAIKAMSLIGEHNDQIERIRQDRNLTPEGKTRRIAAVHLRYRRQVTQLEAEDKASRASQADSLRRSLFGLYGTDPNSLISYRDAQDRAGSIDSEDKALDLLDRADLSNDEILAKAIVGRAAEIGWNSVVRTYTAKHPYYGEKLQELAQLGQDETSVEAIMNHAMSYSLPAPAEVARYSEGMIEQLAAGA